jgi:DNA-binding transcriptional ArsR family regulator
MKLATSDTRTRPRLNGPDKKTLRAKLATFESPVRTAIADSLVVRASSAAELAEELNLPVEKVRYHLRRMRAGGLVDTHARTRRRGVTENLYSIDARRLILSDLEAASLPDHRLDYAHARALRLMFRDAMEAVHAGRLFAHPAYTAFRFTMPLDEEGKREAREILDQLVDTVMRVRHATLERLEAGGEEGMIASAAILSFGRASGETP